jgi:hypothetical protein
MAMGPFLDDVIFQPIVAGSLEWPVAFEMLIGYLRMIENEPSRYRLSNVVHASGGMDAKRAEATALAKGLYAATCFRRPRGEPRDVTDSNAGKKEEFKGTVAGFDSARQVGCTAWNLGGKHLARHVDANGKCRFNHACDQFVTDKGKGGQCLGPHKRAVCDYDPSKKCSTPAKQ